MSPEEKDKESKVWLFLAMFTFGGMVACLICGRAMEAVALAITVQTFLKCLEHDENCDP